VFAAEAAAAAAARRSADERVPRLVADRATEDLDRQTRHSQRRDQQTARTTMEGQSVLTLTLLLVDLVYQSLRIGH